MHVSQSTLFSTVTLSSLKLAQLLKLDAEITGDNTRPLLKSHRHI